MLDPCRPQCEKFHYFNERKVSKNTDTFASCFCVQVNWAYLGLSEDNRQNY